MTPAEQICRLTEKSLGKKIKTPKDFNFLSKSIYARIHQQISPTTLKRIWGYQKDEGPSRTSSLDILSLFCGYKNWKSFCNNYEKGETQSGLIFSRCIYSHDLTIGQRIRLDWAPDRTCLIEYKGDSTFLVLSSENSKITKGNTFKCDVFIEQEPLFVYGLIQGDNPGVCYSAGRKDGIRFELIQSY